MSSPAPQQVFLSTAEIQAAAIRISRLLRDAKVDAPLRPRVLATLVLAAAQGGLNHDGDAALAAISQRAEAALHSARLSSAEASRLMQVLRLTDADYPHLSSILPSILAILNSIGVEHALRTDLDFFGVFYEAFLRYGYDNNALGIVFTPRHITRFCVELAGVGGSDRVIDIACGSGGFLVPAYERLLSEARVAACDSSRRTICGFDTNPTVWALASINLLIRGVAAGGSNARGGNPIELCNCFDALEREDVRRGFTRSFLNPPFSQDGEPERHFLDAAMEVLEPGGRCAAVVKAGVFADEEHARWRAEFLRKHTLLAVISLPEDVFYPTAAPTSVVLAMAHIPQPDDAPVLMARVWNDGFEKLKNKRVERSGSELPEVRRCFETIFPPSQATSTTVTSTAPIPRVISPVTTVMAGSQIRQGNEWSPQEWLPQPEAGADELLDRRRSVLVSIFRSVAAFPELADAALDDFTAPWQGLPPLPLRRRARLDEFFYIVNGKSSGEKNYLEGRTPYVSSGGSTSSIVRLVEPEERELIATGGITVTAFGDAALQPWAFLARGNGGSAVRVLVPRFRMGIPELVWFAAQINAQKWRFFYARMAIKSRIERLVVTSPPVELPRPARGLADKIQEFRGHLSGFSRLEE